MEITDVRIKLVSGSNDRLKAFGSATFDGEFVVRDIKIVEGEEGFFVAMPSRKLSARCQKCRHKNQLRARFCEECGAKLSPQNIPLDVAGRSRLYQDVAHPITPEFRERLQAQIIEAYQSACDEAIQEAAPSDVDVDAPSADDQAMSSVDEDAAGDEEDAAGDEEDAAGDEVEADDYNSLIADLRGGEKNRGNQRAQPSDPSASIQETGRPPRRRRRDPSSPRVGESERFNDAPAPSTDTAEPGSPAAEPAREQTMAPVDGEFTTPASLPAESVASPQPASDGRPEEEATSSDQDAADPASVPDLAEDSTPFGLGIL